MHHQRIPSLRCYVPPFQLPRMLISTDQATVPLSDITSPVEAPNTIALWCRLYELVWTIMYQCIHEPENKA